MRLLPPVSRRQFISNLFTGSVGLGVLASGVGAAQGYALAEVNPYSAQLSGLQAPLRIAVLADLHYGLYIGMPQVRSWVKATLAIQADLIVLVGDFVDVDLLAGMPQAFLDELGRLTAPLGVYGVWGNHDYGSFGYRGYAGQPAAQSMQQARADFAAAFEARGIHILRNEGVALRPDVFLGGVDDPHGGNAPDAVAALQGALPQAARVLLSHRPDLLMRLASGVLPPHNSLMLSGHTHGGQIRFPLIGAPVVPSDYGQRLAQGWVHGQDHSNPNNAPRGFVSRGLGMTGLPFRNLCPSEIAVVELQPAGSS